MDRSLERAQTAHEASQVSEKLLSLSPYFEPFVPSARLAGMEGLALLNGLEKVARSSLSLSKSQLLPRSGTETGNINIAAKSEITALALEKPAIPKRALDALAAAQLARALTAKQRNSTQAAPLMDALLLLQQRSRARGFRTGSRIIRAQQIDNSPEQDFTRFEIPKV